MLLITCNDYYVYQLIFSLRKNKIRVVLVTLQYSRDHPWSLKWNETSFFVQFCVILYAQSINKCYHLKNYFIWTVYIMWYKTNSWTWTGKLKLGKKFRLLMKTYVFSRANKWSIWFIYFEVVFLEIIFKKINLECKN